MTLLLAAVCAAGAVVTLALLLAPFALASYVDEAEESRGR